MIVLFLVIVLSTCMVLNLFPVVYPDRSLSLSLSFPQLCVHMYIYVEVSLLLILVCMFISHCLYRYVVHPDAPIREPNSGHTLADSGLVWPKLHETDLGNIWPKLGPDGPHPARPMRLEVHPTTRGTQQPQAPTRFSGVCMRRQVV